MQERQISVEGETFALDAPFHVLATANPVEYEGTYPLPEAQLDRFMLRIVFGYPTPQEEWEVLQRRVERRSDTTSLDTIVDAATLRAMQAAVETVTVDDDVGRYCVDLVTATRAHPKVQLGASPRGALALLLCARAQALIAGRDFTTPDDVKSVAPSVLAHRITVKPELWLTDVSGETITAEVLASVPTPTPVGGPAA
jgi:MoxR-like ATPase